MILTFNSSLKNIVRCNDSFDAAVLYVAYTGLNRNGSSISKEVFEQCISTIYNVPVVANYDGNDDSIGGHDVKIVRKKGVPTMVHVTQPVGVVPESASYWWENVEEEDGAVHEYLCVDVLLWKRQEAYEKIKRDGITAESMEIEIKAGHTEDGVYVVDNFEFLAFCLLGNCEPCFESAALTFSIDKFTTDLNTMLTEVPRMGKFQLKGVNDTLNEKLKLLEKYHLKLDDLDFELANYELGQLPTKLAEIQKRLGIMVDDEDDERTEPIDISEDVDLDEEAVDESDSALEDTDQSSSNHECVTKEKEHACDTEEKDHTCGTKEKDHECKTKKAPSEADHKCSPKKDYSLTANQMYEEIRNVLYEMKFVDCYGDCRPRYWMRDYDVDVQMVYCEDGACGYVLVGIPFAIDNDSVKIDFQNAKRYKVMYVPFEEGTDTEGTTISSSAKYVKSIENSVAEKYTAQITSMSGELNTLRAFKENVLNEKRRHDESEVFSRFSDLDGNEAFEALKENCESLSLTDIEEKCFAIRGRMLNFSVSSQKSKRGPVLPVDVHGISYEPYGGIVKKYVF